MPGAACLRVHAEGQQLALAVVRVGVAAGADRGEADHLLTGAGDEQLVPRAGRRGQRGPPDPGEGGALEPLQHLGGEDGGVRVAPHGGLHQADGRHVAGTGDPDAGVGDGLAPPPWSWTSSDAAERGMVVVVLHRAILSPPPV